jgi:hypothetical protein
MLSFRETSTLNCATRPYYENKKRADDPDAFEEYSNHVQWMGRGGESEEVGKACYVRAGDPRISDTKLYGLLHACGSV